MNASQVLTGVPVPEFFEDSFSPYTAAPVVSSDLKLPHLVIDDVPRITCQQLADLLNDLTNDLYSKIVILDARYYYEYKGGHISSAKNVTSQAKLKSLFHQYANQNVCVICHCEFSRNRGPGLFHLLRDYDREINKYPALCLPEMYVLDGGYKKFYSLFPNLCAGGYTPMRDREYVNNGDLRKCNSQFRDEMNKIALGLLKRSKSASVWSPQVYALPQPSDMFTQSFLKISASQETSL